jgi:hypothetical protein
VDDQELDVADPVTRVAPRVHFGELVADHDLDRQMPFRGA